MVPAARVIFDGLGVEVVDEDGFSGADQVAGKAAAHLADADESDLHESFSFTAGAG